MMIQESLQTQQSDFFNLCQQADAQAAGDITFVKTLVKTKSINGESIINNKYRVLRKLGQGSQAKVKLVQLVEEFIDESYVPQYFAAKIFFKPYLKKQRSFNRSSSTSSKSSSSSSRRRMTFTTALDEVYREIEIMKKLDNPNMIKIYEVIDDPVSEKLYVIMPVADYGDCIEWDAQLGRFHPNHRLQAKNINKAHKINPKDAQYNNRVIE